MKENFEKLIEYIINDETEKAQELFHQYVVSQSREIYNELVAEDEMSDEEDEDKMEENIVDEYSTDETDTMMSDISADEEGMDQEDDDMMGGDDDMMGGEFGADDEFGSGKEENEFQSMFEYVNKVALPKHGDNGINNKSLFNKPKYNDMGGVAPKFGGTAGGEGTKGGLLNPSAGDLTKGLGKIQNREDAKAGKTAFKTREPGHGAESKGKRETAANTKSLIPGRK
jgi:hypothetical protein